LEPYQPDHRQRDQCSGHRPPDADDTLRGSLGDGVLKSTDGGANWSAVNTGLTNLSVISLAIDSQTPTTLYAGTAGSGAFKSTDGGGTWAAVNSGLQRASCP